MQERLQKILSGAGVCSRRAAEKLIASGAVTVNGEQAQVGDRADLDTDTICVNGRRIGGHESKTVRCASCRSADWISTPRECCS